MARSLHGRFIRGLSVSPKGAALRVAERSLSYEEMHATALAWAGTLLNAAPQRLDRVGLFTTRGPDTYLGLLAALYAGAAVVPLDPRFPAARTLAMVNAAQPSAFIVDDYGRRRLEELSLSRSVDVPVLHGGRLEGAGCEPPLSAPRPVSPADTAYVLFTSGSTGRPKGVPITHGNVDHYLETIERRYRFTKSDVFTQLFDITFDLAMFDLFAAWGSGATVVSTPSSVLRRFPEFAARHDVTVWFSTPSAISVLRRANALGPRALPSLRWSLFCGEPLRLRDAETWQAAAPNSTVENLYGPTELTISCSAHRYDPAVSPALCVNGILPIGTLHDGLRYLLRDEHGSTGTPEGELCVTGPQLFPGYLDPADDKDRFLSHDSLRWYRTGDRVRLGAHQLAYLGRTDDQVKVRGQRVELAEIDSGINSCEGVTEGTAVTVQVNGETELFAFYSGAATESSVEKHLAQLFPLALVPRYVQRVDELPRNSNGKISRMSLRTLAQDHLQACSGVIPQDSL